MNNTFTNKQANLILEISEDRLSAWLTIKKTGRLIDEQEILDLIDAAGIKYGFDGALRYTRKHNLVREFDIKFPIAMCKATSIHQTINHYFDVEEAKDFSAKIDPLHISRLSCLEAGTVLADFNDNIFEREGSIYNVLGEMISFDPKQLEGDKSLAGENVVFDPEKGRFTSTKAGYVSIDDDGRMHIIDELYVSGDLEGVHDLRLPVNLSVNGNVEDSSLWIGGNLLVTGHISQSRVYCGGNLQVKQQIQDCRKPGIEVLGSVESSLIKGSRLLCKGELSCGGIDKSEIVGEKCVSVYGNGGISNSNVQSISRIQAGFVGQQGDANFTQLEITISPFHKTLLMQLTKDLVHAKQEGFAQQAEEIALKIGRIEVELDKELERFLTDEDRVPAKIVISGEILPELKVRILKHSYEIQQAQSGLYIEEKNE
jgi:uncharacterized protein (DUF342 family)